MKTGYGSDRIDVDSDVGAAESMAFMRPKAPRATPGSTKRMLAGVGIVVVAGTAAVAYHQTRALPSFAVEPMSLEAMQFSAGMPFQLRNGGLCMDDGGGWTNGKTAFSLQPCDVLNVNQVFMYDDSTKLIRSFMKPGMCVDDGGGKDTKFRLWECDGNSNNQKFYYYGLTQHFRSFGKEGWCMDTGGGSKAGETSFQMASCGPLKGSQWLEVVNAATDQNQLASLTTLMQGVPIQLGAWVNWCVDDGGGTTNGQTKFVSQPCDASSPNQVFIYDPMTKLIHSKSKQNMCVDDGGGKDTKFHLWQCDPNNINQKFRYAVDTQHFYSMGKSGKCIDSGGGKTAGATQIGLADCGITMMTQRFPVMPVAQDATQAAATNALLQGKPVQLRIAEKNLCMDDGGGTSNGQTKFVLQPCDASSPNQIFQYDAANKMLLSVNKPNMCVDDAGGTQNGQTKFHLWDCGVDNINQKFDYFPATQQFKSVFKKGKCMDDGGGQNAGQSQFHLWDCAAWTPNQRFQVVPYVSPQVDPAVAAATDIMMQGKPVQLRIAEKNLCMDDGGGTSNGQTKFVLQPCDASSPNQVFQYDAANKMLLSVNKPNMCVDDAGGTQNGQTKFHLWECGTTNINQKFDYLPTTQQFKSVNKKGKCIDDGGGQSAGQTQFHLWDCVASTPNQRFQIVSVAERRIPPMLRDSQEVVLALADKPGLCMDDGGGHSNAETKFSDMKCNGGSENQIFVYDPVHFMFRSARKPNMCLDDGGSHTAGETTFHLWECGNNNINQRFIYIEETMQVRNPIKNLCMDDGGGRAGDTRYVVVPCVSGSSNQRFSILSPSDPAVAAKQEKWVVDHPLLQSGQNFIMRAMNKDNLCVDDGGGTAPGQTPVHLWTCDQGNLNQVFKYDPASYSIRSMNKVGLCLDDGGGTTNGQTKFRMWPCDPSSKNQKFVYDQNTQLFRNPTKTNMCMDDGGVVYAGQAGMHLWDCAVTNLNQHFAILPWQPQTPPPISRYDVPDYLRNGQEIVIFAATKPGICVDDGGGTTNGQTKFRNKKCNSNSVNQIFVYDPVNYMFRSARKPNMCLDDGGSHFAGETQFPLWECGADNINQRFIYEEATQHVRNPVKEQCMDSSNGVYTMQQCSGSPDQAFSILWQSEAGAGAPESPSEAPVFAPQPQDGHAILVTGKPFIIQQVSKGNLCMGFGPPLANGEIQLAPQPCDPGSPFLQFMYDQPHGLVIRSVLNPNLCVDDGWRNEDHAMRLVPCDYDSKGQKFVYNNGPMSFETAMRISLCVDDNGSPLFANTKFVLSECDSSKPTQQFKIIGVGQSNEVPQPPMIPPPGVVFPPGVAYPPGVAVPPGVAYPPGVQVPPGVAYPPGYVMPPNGVVQPLLSEPGLRKFVIRRASDGANMCLGYGPILANNDIELRLQPCALQNPMIQFVYDIDNGIVRSVRNPSLCLDDGWRADERTMRLSTCDFDSEDQKFSYNGATMALRNPKRGNMCVDDNRHQLFVDIVFRLDACDSTQRTQHFELIGFEETYPPPGVLPPGMPPMLMVVGNGTYLNCLGGIECAPSFQNDQSALNGPGGVPPPGLIQEPSLPDEGVVVPEVQTIEPIIVGPGGIYRPPVQEPILPDEGGVFPEVQTIEPIMVGPGGIYRPPTDQQDVDGGVQQPILPDEGGVVPEVQTIEPIMVGPGGIYHPPEDESTVVIPTSIDEDLEPETAPPNPVDPSNPHPTYEDTIYDDDDWNLLAPSKTTIHIVNSDGSDDITSGEIFAYLLGLKDTAESTYNKMLVKYHRTSQCVSRGLESLAKTALTEDEYHALVQWMYQHCVVGGGTTAPLPPVVPVGVPTMMPQSTEVGRVYMTKLEFYQQIKDHFASEREELESTADAARLRSGMGSTQRKKLLACIEEASNRFGREKAYEDPTHFHDAILWVNDECMKAP